MPQTITPLNQCTLLNPVLIIDLPLTYNDIKLYICTA